MSAGNWAIAVHGGAKDIPPGARAANEAGCRRALEAGAGVLRGGGTAVDAVEAAIRVLEDDPTFNAGHGAVPTARGEAETDAALMDGETLDIGAVAALRGVRNPVSVARLMLRDEPVLLVGEGARVYATERGAALARPGEMVAEGSDSRHDTVGCVALDTTGHLAAGTSTGGLAGTLPGRVGDSPLPGCGFYAEDGVGATALSGDGERIARTLLAAQVMRHLPDQGPQGAADAAIKRLARVGGEAGCIVLSPDGQVGWAHNSAQFAVGWVTSGSAGPAVRLEKGGDAAVTDEGTRDEKMAESRDTPAPKGVLAIIGGHEDRKGDRKILKEFARRLKGDRKVVLSTVASHEPEGYFDEYRRAFDDLDVRDLTELYVEDREEAGDKRTLDELDGVSGVFFSGGDQLRIHEKVGDTPVERLVRRIYERGGIVAGTSAGAAAMGETMLAGGPGGESHHVGDLKLAPGLGLLPGCIVDQHFAQRGRIGRLLAAVAQDPALLGIGIDEDTAIFVEGGSFEVVGNGAVYVVDGQGMTRTNIDRAREGELLSLCDVRLHVLAPGDRFNLDTRRPGSAPDLRESHEKEADAA